MIRNRPLTVRLRQAVCLVAVGAWCSIAVAHPANDNFADRIRLSGEDLEFDVDLEGATLERQTGPHGEVFGFEVNYGWEAFYCGTLFSDAGSAWWEWTAPRAGTIVVYPALSDGQSEIPECLPEVVVFRRPWEPTPDRPLHAMDLSYPNATARRSPYVLRYASPGFHAEAGETFILQAIGGPGARGHFRLRMPGGPLVFESPTDRTLRVGETSFLNVVATGDLEDGLFPYHRLAYQWFQEGRPLEGENFASLLLSKVDASSVGAYQVVVSDSEGSVTSAVARVTVSQTEVPPVLLAGCESDGTRGDSRNPCWTLLGERGRYYVIESSSNLVDWTSQPVEARGVLPVERYVSSAVKEREEVSHVLLARGSFAFQPRSSARTLFLRARRIQPLEEARVALFWIVDLAKEEFGRAMVSRSSLTYAPSAADISPLVSPAIVRAAFQGPTECLVTGVVLGTLGSPTLWPCVPLTPEALGDPYWMLAPFPVWNAR